MIDYLKWRQEQVLSQARELGVIDPYIVSGGPVDFVVGGSIKLLTFRRRVNAMLEPKEGNMPIYHVDIKVLGEPRDD